MGRHKKPDGEKRSCRVAFRLTEEEKKLIDKAVHYRGYDSLSLYIRDLIHLDNPYKDEKN